MFVDSEDIDLAFKANPPAGYPYPPVNLVDAITAVRDNLMNKKYENEFAWQSDLFKTFVSLANSLSLHMP